MSDFERIGDACLPPSDRAETPDPPAPSRETFSQKLIRLARELHPEKMAQADALAAKMNAHHQKRSRADDYLASARHAMSENSEEAAAVARELARLPPIMSREPGEDG